MRVSDEMLIVTALISAAVSWASCYFYTKRFGNISISALVLVILIGSFVLFLIGENIDVVSSIQGHFPGIAAIFLFASVVLPAALTSVSCAIFLKTRELGRSK